MKNYKLTKLGRDGYFEEIEYEVPKNKICDWRNIGDGKIKNIKTGEIKEIKKKKCALRSIKSITKSLQRINYYISYNFEPEYETVYSVDFTYRKQPKDYSEYEKDLTKLKRKLKRKSAPVKAIIVKELGRSLNYHGHLIMSQIDITEEEFRQMWNLGDEIKFQIIKTKIGLLRKSKYLTNIANDYANSFVKRINGQNFPQNKKLYMVTNNLVLPESDTSEVALDKTDTTTIFVTPEEKVNRTKIKFETFKFNDDIAA